MSQNITVSCRRSASWLSRAGSGAGGAAAAGPDATGGSAAGASFRAAIARTRRLRSPSEIPSWIRSASVRSARMSKPMSLSAKASA